ncbi:YjcZ family sporulation protein [Bacillus sp. H-16]|nr:YjcZ family sporulation protein [Alteribacter salitolerans]MBM7096133.1 YjcZ family sporulation protein [Alteribacter salitolerans]
MSHRKDNNVFGLLVVLFVLLVIVGCACSF